MDNLYTSQSPRRHELTLKLQAPSPRLAAQGHLPGQCLAGLHGQGAGGEPWVHSFQCQLLQDRHSADTREKCGNRGHGANFSLVANLANDSQQMEAPNSPGHSICFPWASSLIELSISTAPPHPSSSQGAQKDVDGGPPSLWFLSALWALALRILGSHQYLCQHLS